MELLLLGLAFICLGAAIRFFADVLLDFLAPVAALLAVSVLGAYGLSELTGWPLPLAFVAVGLPVVLVALLRSVE